MQKRVLVLTGGIVAASLLLFAPAGLAASAGDGAGSPQAGVGALQQRVAASFAQTARQHLDAGRIKEAIEDFTAALSFDPAHSGAREGLVLADARLGEAAGAAKPPAPKPARPANADIIRAQASLTVMNASARQLLARGDYSARVAALSMPGPEAGQRVGDAADWSCLSRPTPDSRRAPWTRALLRLRRPLSERGAWSRLRSNGTTER